METPKKTQEELNNGDESFQTPSSNYAQKKGVVVTPGSNERINGALIKEPHDNDVLCGRGGSINSHKGNERFRSLVEKRKRVYLTARFKREKRLIANSIVSEIRSLDPPGRFLSRDSKTGLWCDIGDEKARDKTSQALRENAPSIRAEIEVEINQQRAEMQRAEEEEAARNMHRAHHHHGPPHHYYQQPWGYYAAPYHGYGQYPPEHAMDASQYEGGGHWHHGANDHGPPPVRSTGSLTSRRGGPGGHYTNPTSPGRNREHHHRERGGGPPVADPHEDPDASGFDVPKFVSSVPSTIANWTRNSLSFTGASSFSSDNQDQLSQCSAPTRRPIQYAHSQSDDHREGRRSVHFEDDRRRRAGTPDRPQYVRPHPHHHHQSQHFQKKEHHSHPHYQDYYPAHASHRHHNHHHNHPSPSGTFSPIRKSNSITPDSDSRRAIAPRHVPSNAIAPHNPTGVYDGNDQQSSLLSQVANHILGSWDTIACANDSTEEPDGERKPSIFPTTSMCHSTADPVQPPPGHPQGVSLADAMEDEEGQEIELVDMMECESADELQAAEAQHVVDDDEARMPPPEPPMSAGARKIEFDWPSKMMGCQTTWLPETFQQGAFFSPKNNPLSPSTSMMDESAAGTEGISYTGSVGGGSLCQVFSHDHIGGPIGGPTTVAITSRGERLEVEEDQNQVLTQMPSWERSFRSKSPSTICSEDEKPGHISPIVPPLSPRSKPESERDLEMKGE